MSKIKIIGWAIAVIVVVSLGSFAMSNKTQSETIKIGVIFPITGSNASYSEKFLKGLNLAKDEINLAGGIDGKNIELVIEDGMADPAKSVTAYKKLKQENKDMHAVISAFSSVLLAIAPIANSDNVVLMNPVASSANLSKAGDYEFNIMPLMSLTVTRLADYIRTVEKIDKAGVIYVNTDFGKSGNDIFKAKFESLGGKIVVSESYTDGDIDLRTQLLKIKQANPEAIYLATTGKSGGAIVKQIGELGINAKLFSTDGIEVSETISIGGDRANGLVYISPAFDANSSDPVVKKFADAFQAKYNSSAEVYGANNYDSLKLLAIAIENAGNKGEKIKNYLYSVRNYAGVSGNLSFDENGDVIKPMIVKSIQNGQFVKISN